MANWGGERASARADGPRQCLACGGPIEVALDHVGSLRCLDCRDARRPLDPALVETPDGSARLRGPAGWFIQVREFGRRFG
jgi:hypothetical protein